MIHGNLKPSNVLVAAEKDAFKGWVTESGLAKIVAYRPPGELMMKRLLHLAKLSLRIHFLPPPISGLMRFIGQINLKKMGFAGAGKLSVLAIGKAPKWKAEGMERMG